MNHTQQLQIESLSNTVHDIFFIFMIQAMVLGLLAIYLFWVWHRSHKDAQDWFKNYHEAFHAANPGYGVLPPKSLASKSGHAVVSEPIVVPKDDMDDVEVHTGETTVITSVPSTGSGRHRA